MSKAKPRATTKTRTASKPLHRVNIPKLCGQVAKLMASADVATPGKRREPPKPPASICNAALQHPDLKGVALVYRNSQIPYIPSRIIEEAIRDVGTIVDRLDDPSGAIVLVHYSARKLSAADRAQAKRLKRRLAIAKTYEKRLAPFNAAVKADEKRVGIRSDKAAHLEAKVCNLQSRTQADLLAKARLYQSDPACYGDAVSGAQMNLAESVARDVVALFGAKGGAA